MKRSLLLCVVLFPLAPHLHALDLSELHNPVWISKDNLRDPAVLKTDDGYRVFYSRLAGTNWSSPDSWTIAEAFTKDFVTFEKDRDISPKGYASPGDLVTWFGRHLLPYQSYPAKPVRLCVAESKDLQTWSEPRIILPEAADLPWNGYHRVIDPTFVVEGETLHCFFVGSADVTNEEKKIRANLLGHAITHDPNLNNWQILTTEAPLIGVSDRAPDGVENIMIYRTDDQWTMLYSEGLASQHLARASSTNLIDWTLEGEVEIERQPWMSRKYGAPFVWRDDAQWMMILMGENAERRTTFGLLSSTDGKAWTPVPPRATEPAP